MRGQMGCFCGFREPLNTFDKLRRDLDQDGVRLRDANKYERGVESGTSGSRFGQLGTG